MRLDRISLQLVDGEVRTFELHRGLTVVEAEPGSEGALARALLGTLSSAGDGVHVELTLDDGRGYVVFRPFGAAHRVIDLEDNSDATFRFATADGVIDALAPFCAGPRPASAELVVSGDDLRHGDPTDAWVAQLAAHDATTLARAADEAVAAEADLRRASEAARGTGTADEGRDTAASLARASAAAAERRHRVLLPTTAVVGSGLALGAAAGVDTLGTGGSLALIGSSLGLVAGTLLYGRRVSSLRRAASQELPPPATAAPVADDGPVRSTGAGPDLAVAASRFHHASAAWAELAGTVPASWALAERDRIERTARLRARLAPGSPGAEPLTAAPEAAATIAGLTVRMASSHGAGAEALPLFLDDPLTGLSWEDKAPVLEFLGQLALEHQLVLVTADPEVLSWARLEAMAGGVGAITSSSPTAGGEHVGAPVELDAGGASTSSAS